MCFLISTKMDGRMVCGTVRFGHQELSPRAGAPTATRLFARGPKGSNSDADDQNGPRMGHALCKKRCSLPCLWNEGCPRSPKLAREPRSWGAAFIRSLYREFAVSDELNPGRRPDPRGSNFARLGDPTEPMASVSVNRRGACRIGVERRYIRPPFP